MRMGSNRVELDTTSGGITFFDAQNKPHLLHPLWIRERTCGPDDFDALTQQRLYEHAEFAPDLKITSIDDDANDQCGITFSDGYSAQINLNNIRRELGWQSNSEAMPIPRTWNGALNSLPEMSWHDLDDPKNIMALLETYFQHGFCIINDTPTEKDSLKTIARRFGYMRETNFGELFNVETKPNPSDLAYTDVALASHTDNPYRQPVPGIQFLHCLKNEVAGGMSTLVDGIAIAEALHTESPEQARMLEEVVLRYRYEGPSAILEHHGPIIERDHRGYIRHIRLSSRLDYVPAIAPERLDVFYAGRRRLHEMSNSAEFQISFPFKPGLLLMMDNYRLLHGRTAFNGKQGHRHLQGGYIDHDGPASLYRMLKRGDQITWAVRET
ncbi:MAG: TauD/TfdA family dioxygenase [Maricaulaceae bacterium]